MKVIKLDKKLWKNIDWKNKEEKEMFFNKYFNTTKRELVHLQELNYFNNKQKRILGYMKTKIKEKNKERLPTILEIEHFIMNL